jgi:hypothetical protein
VDDKRFGGSVGKFCNGIRKKRKRATARQSAQYEIKPPMKMVSMYMGFIFYEDFYIAAMESLTSSMGQEKVTSEDNPVPMRPIIDPLKSGNSPNVPLNQENMDIKKIWDNLKRENDNIFSYREKLDFRGLNGTSGQPSDSDGPSKNINGIDSDINGTSKQKPATSASTKNEINEVPEEENASTKKVRWTEEEPLSKPCGSCDVAIKGDMSAIKCEDCSFLRKETEADILEVYFLKDQVEPWQGINFPRRVLHEAGTAAFLPAAEAGKLIQAGIAWLATKEV